MSGYDDFHDVIPDDDLDRCVVSGHYIVTGSHGVWCEDCGRGYVHPDPYGDDDRDDDVLRAEVSEA